MSPLRSRVSLLVITLVLAFASVASASTNANLAVSQAPTMDGDRTAGSTMTYLVHVTNNGPDSVANVTFGDQLGDPEQFMSAHTSTGDACTQAPPVSCTLQRVDPGADITIQIVVKLTKTGSNSNSYAISAADNTDSDPNNDLGGVSYNVDPPAPTVTNTPSVKTGFVTQIAQAHLDVQAELAPYGSGTWWLEYGKTKAYGQKTSAEKVSGNAGVKRTATIDGLSMATTYHFRAVLEVGGKVYRGADQSEKTFGKQRYADLTIKATHRGATSTSYAGGFKNTESLDAPGACKGEVVIEVYTTDNVDILQKHTRMGSNCKYAAVVPFGSSQARKYGPKGKVIVQAYFQGSYAIARVGSLPDKP